jgi:hypothetical protein
MAVIIPAITDYFAGRRIFIRRPARPQVVLTIILKCVAAVHCSSSRKKHCGVPFMLLVTVKRLVDWLYSTA